MNFKDFLNEKYEWLSKPKAKFVSDMEERGLYKIEVSDNTNTIKIVRRNKRTGKPTKGLVIYQDGSAVDIMVDLSISKVMRSINDWKNVLK